MERRRAIAIAAAVSATAVGAVSAVAANFGLLDFGQAPPTPIGSLGAMLPASAEPAPGPGGEPAGVTVRYEDIYLPAPPAADAGTSPAATAGDDAAAPGAAGGSGSENGDSLPWDDGYGDDDHDDHDDDDDDDRDDDDHDDDRDERDGHEDDD